MENMTPQSWVALYAAIVSTSALLLNLVSFLHYDLGYFDLEQKTLQPLDNPLGTRLSPMS